MKTPVLVTLVLVLLAVPALADAPAAARLLAEDRPETSLRLPFDAPAFVDPRSVLPDVAGYPAEDLAALFRYARDCSEADRAQVLDASLRKAKAWHELVCGDAETLPARFFESEPPFHPGGSSFIALAARSGMERFDRGWLAGKAHRLHVLESDLLLEAGLPVDDGRRLLLDLAPAALRELVDRAPLVVGERFVFVLEPSGAPTDPGAYLVYARESYDAALAPETRGHGKLLLGLTVAGGLVLALVVLVQALRRVRLRRQLMHERARVLRTLAHEVRTPTSSLKLVLEELRADYDHLPARAQKGFLALCDEVNRLEQVIRESGRYLGAFQEDPTRGYRRVGIDSVNAFVEGVLEPYRGRLTFEPLDEDPGVVTDPYWFAVCIRNLVENALTHGAPPVVVQLGADRRRLHLTVSDGGTARPGELQRGLRPFLRARTSPGFGLGLAIVSDTVAGLRGKLTWSTGPTRFTMSLRRSA